MANPNIVSVASIYGKTAYNASITTSNTFLVNNAASSGKIFKINSFIIANIDGSNAADITITLRNASGSTIFSYLANTISVPGDATLVVISKDTSIYLEEDMALVVQASVSGDLSATCSYEEISE